MEMPIEELGKIIARYNNLTIQNPHIPGNKFTNNVKRLSDNSISFEFIGASGSKICGFIMCITPEKRFWIFSETNKELYKNLYNFECISELNTILLQ